MQMRALAPCDAKSPIRQTVVPTLTPNNVRVIASTARRDF